MTLAAISRAPDESGAARLLKCCVPTKTQSYRTKVELCVINVGLMTRLEMAFSPICLKSSQLTFFGTQFVLQ
jgi:hypothetical protein